MKKVIVVLCVLVAVALLFPVPCKTNNGSTLHYNAILYDVYTLTSDGTGGVVIELCGIEIFNDTALEYDHEQNGDEGLEDESAPYFVGKIVEKNERGFLLKITDSGNGSFCVGEAVQVNVDASGYPDYAVGDHLRIAFDGKVALSYPPQVTSVTSIRKTDSQGNDID